MKPDAPVMMRRGISMNREDCTQVPRPRPHLLPRPKLPKSACGLATVSLLLQWPLSRRYAGHGRGLGLGRGLPRYNPLVHEMGIALEIYRTCRETVEANGGGTLQSARIAVGELSAVEPDLLTYAWEAAVFEGPDAGAKLVVEWRPAIQYCGSCEENKDRVEGSWMRICPDCGMPLEVSGGSELDVLDLTFESDEGADNE